MKAFVKKLRDNGECFDIKLIRLSLVYSVDEKPKSNQFIGPLVFKSVCTLKYARDSVTTSISNMASSYGQRGITRILKQVTVPKLSTHFADYVGNHSRF